MQLVWERAQNRELKKKLDQTSVDYERIGEVVRSALAKSHKPIDCVETDGHGGAEIMQEVGKMLTATRSESRYWRLDRAAQECGVAPRTFAEWMADGKVRFFKLGRVVLIDPEELKEDLSKFRRQKMPKRRARRKEVQPQLSTIDLVSPTNSHTK